VQLTGRHDVDQGWLKDVRNVVENATAPLIVPRFMFHGWLLEDYQHLFAEQTLINQLIALLVRECVYVLPPRHQTAHAHAHAHAPPHT